MALDPNISTQLRNLGLDPTEVFDEIISDADVASAAAQAAADAAQATADAALPTAGGTLSGPLVLVGNPTASLQPATKAYTDTADAAVQAIASAALPKAGGTMTGAITLSADAAAALQPASKQQLDAVAAQIAGAIAGVTLKGTWNASSNSPSLASGVGTQGDTWIVATAGTTTLDGISSWSVGDQAFFAASTWHRAPFSSAFGTMAVQNATSVAITGGTATVASLGITGGANIGPLSGAVDDAYFTDVDGAVVSKFNNSTHTWQHNTPLSAPTAAVTTLTATTANVTTVNPSSIAFAISGTPESSISAATSPFTTQPLMLMTDPDGGVVNKLFQNTGEWSRPKGIAPSLINAGRYRTRLTCKPIMFGDAPNDTSTANTTYAAVFTTEGQGANWRFIVPSASVGPANIQLIYAFSDHLNDGINPVIGGQPAPWSTATWLNAGQDVDYIDQLAALNAVSFVAPTTFALPQADDGNATSLQVFHDYLTDWMPGTGVLRTDGGSGACLVFVRLLVTTGTLLLASNTGDLTGNYDQYLFNRIERAYSQITDGVNTPSNFTSTTRTGKWAVHGIQYESLNRGICIMCGGDSTTAGAGSDFTRVGAWQKIKFALSTPTTPVELARYAQPASDSLTYALEMGNAIDFVRPTVAYLQSWSRNSWKVDAFSGGANQSMNGHASSLQILMGGTITPGDVVTATITDSNVTGSPVSVNYTVQVADTLATVAIGLAAAVTATTALFSKGYRAWGIGPWCTISFPSTPATAGTASVGGGATLTATGYFGYYYIPQIVADMSLAATMAIADRVEAYDGVMFVATLYGDIGNTLQVDQWRQKVNTAIRAMTRAVVADYDTALSLATGPAGAPQIPVPAYSADGVHPNDIGHLIEFYLLFPLFKAVYGL